MHWATNGLENGFISMLKAVRWLGIYMRINYSTFPCIWIYSKKFTPCLELQEKLSSSVRIRIPKGTIIQHSHALQRQNKEFAPTWNFKWIVKLVVSSTAYLYIVAVHMAFIVFVQFPSLITKINYKTHTCMES